MVYHTETNRLSKGGEAMKDTKQRVMEALLDDQNETLTAAARAAKVSRRTVYNLLSEEDFAKAYQHQREAQAIERAERLEAKRQQAIDDVFGIMLDTSQPGATRLKAASLLLSEANAAQDRVDAISKSMTFTASWF